MYIHQTIINPILILTLRFIHYRCLLLLFSSWISVCNLIDKQPIALFGTSQAEAVPIFESYSRAFRIPFFIPTQTRGAFKDADSYIVSMYPSFIDGVIELIKFFKWKRIFYLFDSDDGMIQIIFLNLDCRFKRDILFDI